MSRRIFCKLFLIVVAVVGVLVFSGVLQAQGRSVEAFERVKEVQERHTKSLMAIKGVEGTAIGLDDNDQPVVKVFIARSGISGIPDVLESVPVHVVVTGKFYALPKGGNGGGRSGGGNGGGGGKGPKDRTPPASPTGLNATTASESRIDLDWNDNSDSDLSYYRVYRASASGGPYSRIASSVSSSSYSDTALAASTSYYYLVTAVDNSRNESADSSEAWATTDEGSAESPIGPRPAPIGISTGHPDITAGTIACRVTDGINVYALSNNHVYANENNSAIGDNVLQPGPYDGGQDPRDVIGTLFDFESIVWYPFGLNTIDAAIALTSVDKLTKATPADGYGTPKSTTVTASVGMDVQKYGRTTGQTSGQVTAINATVNVGYDSGIALFVGQIIIEPGGFSAGGDSGSLVVTKSDNPDDDRKPVGLLFAGSSSVTIASPIDLVLTRFGVTIDGE